MLPSNSTPVSQTHTDAEGSQRFTEGKAEAVGEAPLQFLTFTDFHQTRNSETRRQVRSHAMHEVHRRNRDGRSAGRRGAEIVLDTSYLGQSRTPAESQTPDHSTSLMRVTSPSTIGAGRIDPFVNYPIQMNQRTYELFDHLRGDFCPMFKTMHKIGFFQTMTDVAGFLQVLCTSASHQAQLRASQSESAEAITFSTQAIQSVNTRLGDPAQCTSDGIVATILAFCCHAIMFHDINGSVTHMKGLEEIVRRRGGLATLEQSPVLRMILFWADTNIAFVSNSIPRFQAPYDLLPALGVQATTHNNKHLVDRCEAEDFVLAMNDMYALNQLIVSQKELVNFWTDGLFAGKFVVPVLHKLLSLNRDYSGFDKISLKQEASKTGAVLYLGAVRCCFGVELSPDAQTQKLKELLSHQNFERNDFNPSLFVWLLMIGGTQSTNKDYRDWFVSQTAQAIVSIGCGSWEQVMNNLQEVLWIDGLLHAECERLRQEICASMLNSFGILFS